VWKAAAASAARRCRGTAPDPQALKNLDQPLAPTPVAVYGNKGRYTAALWSAATETNAVDAVAKDARVLLDALRTSSELSSALRFPFLSGADRAKVIDTLASHYKLHAVTKNLLSTLSKNNRLGGTQLVLNEYLKLIEASKGKVEGVLTTAVALDDATYKQLTAQVNQLAKKVLGGNTQAIDLERRVDPSIVGGVLVTFGAYELDLTVRSFAVSEFNKQMNDVLEDASSFEARLLRISRGD